MKKQTKMLGALLTGAMLTAQVVSAAAPTASELEKATPVLISAPVPISAPLPIHTAVPINAPLDAHAHFLMVIDGQAVSPEAASLYLGEQKEIMIPLRAAADALGYKLTWKPDTKAIELMKGNQFITLQVGRTDYSFAKMLVPLTAAPEITDNQTYVPLAFFEQVMKLQVTVEETGTVQIRSNQQDSAEAVSRQGIVTGVTVQEDQQEIGFYSENGLVRIQLSADTAIVSADNTPVSLEDIQLGMPIQATYGPVMAMSFPPIVHAEKIVVEESTATEQVLGTSGQIEQVTSLEDGTTRIVVKGDKLSDRSYETIALNVSSSTVMEGSHNGEAVTADSLQPGDKVYVFYSGLLTRSLPPIGQADKIVIQRG